MRVCEMLKVLRVASRITCNLQKMKSFWLVFWLLYREMDCALENL